MSSRGDLNDLKNLSWLPIYKLPLSGVGQGLFDSHNGQTLSHLISMHVEAQWVDCCLKVQLQQEYLNNSTDNIEAIYKFVIPRSATIGDFYAVVGGRKVTGIVQETEQARNTYDDALSSGHTSYLAEKEEDSTFNSFSISIGNLPPGQSTQVCVSFISIALNKNGKYVFDLPPELVPAGIQISGCCRINMMEQVLDVYSTVGSVSKDMSLVQWSLVPSSVRIMICVFTRQDTLPRAILEFDEKTNSRALMITNTPFWSNLNTDLIESQVEVIFVVDRSGSMEGPRIDQTRQALTILLHALPPMSKFNIIGFGDSQDWLFPTSKPFCEENISLAHNKIQQIQADMGGTNLKSPLKSIFSQAPDIDYPRIILVLTDGSVSDRPGTIDEVRRNQEQCRVFSLGIGYSVDRLLVGGIADAGRGECTFVQSDWEIEAKVMGLFEKAIQPCTRNIKVIWPEQTIQYTPKKLPPIFKGDRLITFGLLEGDVGEYLEIKATDPMGQEIDWSIPIEKDNGHLRNKLAAFQIIRQLESEMDKLDVKQKEQTQKQIVDLAIKFQLVSRYTSIVVVDDLVDTATSTSLKTVSVNVVSPLEEQKVVKPLEVKREIEEHVTRKNESQVETTQNKYLEKHSATEALKQKIEERKKEVAARGIIQKAEDAKMTQYSKEQMDKLLEQERAAEEEAKLMKQRIEQRKRELAAKKAEEESQHMPNFSRGDSIEEQELQAKIMKEKIEQRKRELAARKAEEESQQMAKYMREDSSGVKELEANIMKEKIEQRKRELASKKAEESQQMAKYLREESTKEKELHHKEMQQRIRELAARKAEESEQIEREESSEDEISTESAEETKIEKRKGEIVAKEAEKLPLIPEPLIEVDADEVTFKAKEERIETKNDNNNVKKEITSATFLLQMKETEYALPIQLISRKENLEPLKGQSTEEQKINIVKAQNFDGCWDIETISSLLGISKDVLNNNNPGVSEVLWATALAIGFLEVYLSISANSLKMVSKKGKAYIIKSIIKEKSLSPEASAQESVILIEKAKTFLDCNF